MTFSFCVCVPILLKLINSVDGVLKRSNMLQASGSVAHREPGELVTETIISGTSPHSLCVLASIHFLIL